MFNSDNADKKPADQTPKGPGLMDQAGSAAQTAKESVMEAGKHVQTKTQEAVNYVKETVAPAPPKK